MANPLDDPLYYLHNFRQVLLWLGQRYADLLDPDEQHFIQHFDSLPQASQALLVRMVMRKGMHFRASKLNYVEVGCTHAATAPLVQLGWVDEHSPLTFETLFALLQKGEVLAVFKPWIEQPKANKADWLEALAAQFTELRSFTQWCPHTTDTLYSLTVMDLCDRLRLMFFGNLHQGWSEFVLADLGVFQYETVPFEPSSRAFQTREDVDRYLALHACRQALDDGLDVDALLQAVADCASGNAWLEKRRAKVLLRLGQACERAQDWAAAQRVYTLCAYPGARHRRIRVYERMARFDEALALALQAEARPESEEEAQRLARMLP
ncbi:MAG TPA: nuclease, partial [Pseudomonas sp.]|nr:nuclease [Pseudomonas sp.]